MSAIVNKTKEVLHREETDIKIAGSKIHGIGYGLMGLTWRKNPPTQEQAFAAMKAAVDNGANFWNAGELYGTPERNSLHLLNEYFTKYPNDAKNIVISVKGGLVPGELKPDGSVENTKRSIDECLRVLDGKKKLDLWEGARVDPKTPIEVTIRAANEYVKAGKLGGISLSECSASSIRRAAKVAKIDAVEVEFSLWATEILENGVAETCAELDIPIVAYSPLGRGFLTGEIKKPDDIPEGDMRRHMPRFQPDNFGQNLKLVTEIEALAQRKGVKPGQLAIAWCRAQGKKPGMPIIIPIPGASSVERVKENLVEIELSDADVKELDSLVASIRIVGGRYGGHGAQLEYGDSPELVE
ncbi:hypothetical protein CERZMDRAFT_66017 [Cercospora zeae-maydis SCOH1-5]|uniref:NADP-dependent oxidoreductase domain-containing protein n=1 Tax=Cercospora zeae-maydis SCOH1-5 TaxID=717836 RepID=A0A6A6FMX2_9PEZI|nr:hypothetical protein CERZMDRAFT_66017 [Cercospora zeae-maydis SCOH1-5]